MDVLELLIERDGSACIWCGREPWRVDLTAEHLLPKARHGQTVAENLAIACRACSRRRGTQPVGAYVRSRQDAGEEPRLDLIVAALGRLAASDRPLHARYGRRQLELLARQG